MGGGSYGGRRWQLGRPARPWRKNNKKDWSVGPWTVQGTRGMGQGPGAEGCRSPFQSWGGTGREGAPGCQALQGSGWGGLRGSSFHSCQVGLSWDQNPIPGGGVKRGGQGPCTQEAPPTHYVEASGMFWSWLPLGIRSPKLGPPPPPLEELGSSKPPPFALSGWAVCTGLGHLSLPLSTWALVNLWPGRRPAGMSLQPTVLLSNLSLIKHSAQAPRPFRRL